MAAQRAKLHRVATDRGATFQERDGWELPMSYGSSSDEYRAALEGAALYDSSHVGRIRATGEDTLDLLNRISTNEVVSLEPGQGAPTVLTTDRGRILDLITVHNLGDHVLLLTGPEAREQVVEWIDKYTIVEDLELEDITGQTAMLSLMGPQSGALLEALLGVDVHGLARHSSAGASLAGAGADVIRSGLGDLDRFEVIVGAEDVETVWEALIAAGAKPMGLEAYDALRIQHGIPEHGRELGESYNPLEAGLWGSISFTKGCYIGQEVIARLDTYQKVQRHLVFLRLSPGTPVVEGAKLTSNGREVGLVTSLAKHPGTAELIALGYVRKEAAEADSELGLDGSEGTPARVGSRVLPYGPGAEA